MNKKQLASKIWQSANKMRSKIEANEYKDYILGFMFYKFLSNKETRFLLEEGWTKDDIRDLKETNAQKVEYVKNNLGYFISYDNLFSTWIEKGSDFDVSDVRDALSAFNRNINPTHLKVFDKIFDTLQTGLSKLGDSSGTQTKAISGLIGLINDIPMDKKQNYDVLGYIYEYLISNFAANAGKKAGEFYTPHEVSLLMSEIVAEHLKDHKKISIYDPTSGSGSLLINIGRSVSKLMGSDKNIKYYAQELKENTYNLTRMNLIMRGIIPDNIITRNGDSLSDDWPMWNNDDPNQYEPLYLDAVVSNPPYSQNWEPKNREEDARYRDYGIAPKSKADYAFLLHELFHVRPEGIMTIVLPHGVLFRSGAEAEIRKNLVEKHHIETIIGLPSNIFFGTGIATIIMVLKKNRTKSDILFIDASKGFEKAGKNNQLRACDIKKITDTIFKRETIKNFSKVVSLDEIKENDYNLNIPRYVDTNDKPENYDIYASMFGGLPQNEIDAFDDELKPYWTTFPNLKKELFVGNGTPYLSLATTNIKETFNNNNDVKKYNKKFATTFADFGAYLKTELIDNMKKIVIQKQLKILSENIFSRLSSIALIDKYDAYQILDNNWQTISTDLEIIQSEGFESTKKVDPNMIIKKEGEKEIEKQAGWKGRIIPFELIEDVLLKTESTALKEKRQALEKTESEITELIESTPIDEIETALNDDNSAFATPKLKSALKNDPTNEAFKTATKLLSNKSELTKQIKAAEKELHLKCKTTIENLTDKQVLEMLELKWVVPIVDGINELPAQAINLLQSKINHIAKKYEVTFEEVSNKIKTVEKDICKQIDNLTANEFDKKGLEELKKLLKGGK